MFVDNTQLDINTRGTPLNEWSACRRGNYLHNTQQIQGMNIHTLSGIRTRDHSNRATWSQNRRICKTVRSFSSSPPPMVQKPLLGQGPLIVEVSRLHSDTPHSVGFIRTIERTVAETSTWHHPTLTNTHVPRGIRTQNPSKRMAADPRLKPPGHWDRLSTGTAHKFYTRLVLDPYRLVIT